MKKSTYTLKFYQGRKLIAETTWDANEVFVDEITHDAENMIEEAIQCNPPHPYFRTLSIMRTRPPFPTEHT